MVGNTLRIHEDDLSGEPTLRSDPVPGRFESVQYLIQTPPGLVLGGIQSTP